MIVQHNMSALNTNRMLNITNKSIAGTTEKLASGYRVNRAADDAAGLYISEKMRGQIRGLTQASRNAQDGQSLIQTAEGALNEIHSMIQRERELLVQVSNDTYATADRGAIAAELSQLDQEISRVLADTEFNTMCLLNGNFTGKVFQIGANSSQVISVKISKLTLKLGMGKYLVETKPTSGKQITSQIDHMNSNLNKVSELRSYLGALQNRLEHTIDNDDNMAENLQSSESKIRDTNLADEMVTYAGKNILQQAGQSMLAQANQATQGVLALLR